MKRLKEIFFSNKIRNLYRSLIKLNREFSQDKEIKNHVYLIRNCCLNILNVAKEYTMCDRSERNLPVIEEEIRDFCEISSYNLTEKSISEFLNQLSERKNLSYGEIACLIPLAEYCCLEEIKRRLDTGKQNNDNLIRSLRALNSYDCSSMAEELSNTEDVLKRDDIFPHLDVESKNLYRIKLQRRAEKTKNTSEIPP